MTLAVCSVYKAVRGNPFAYKEVVEAMRKNRVFGNVKMVPCRCKVRCEKPPDDQIRALQAKIQDTLADCPVGSAWAPGVPKENDALPEL